MDDHPTPAAAHDLDAADPLARYRDRFLGVETDLVYFDGNSLGRPLKVTGDRLARFVATQWGERLIRAWDESWLDLPLDVGDDLGRIALGAGPGQVVVGDSTTVLLYKAMRAAVAARPGRTEIVLSRDDFPTDRYVAAGIAEECGLTLRWVDVDPAAGVTERQVVEAVGEQTALLVLSHVSYRSGWVADAAAITSRVHDAGALVLWDLSHSGGSYPVELDAWEADLAVGCSYKYLNGGPGSPAYLYAARRHLAALEQPIRGWLGARDPFLMGPTYAPAEGIRRFQSGTPPIMGLLPMRDMLELIEEAGIAAVREKSVALTDYTIRLADELLSPLGVEVASPRDPARRGGHVTLRHPAMEKATARLWERDVIPDYRDPGGLRIGLSPLSTSFAEVETGMHAIREALNEIS